MVFALGSWGPNFYSPFQAVAKPRCARFPKWLLSCLLTGPSPAIHVRCTAQAEQGNVLFRS